VTGAEHYAEAERLLVLIKNLPSADPSAVQLIATAQVHATLAATPAPTSVGRELVGALDRGGRDQLTGGGRP